MLQSCLQQARQLDAVALACASRNSSRRGSGYDIALHKRKQRRQRCKWTLQPGAWHHEAAVATVSAWSLLSFVPPVCFNQECQAAADRAFLIAILTPVTVAAAVIAYKLRPPPQELQASGRLFDDPATGTLFEAPSGVLPERDKNGELAFRPISYTPWPVAADYEGERVRIDLGPVGATEPRTVVFKKLLPQPSEIILAQLPRPLGIVFEYDERLKRVFVSEFVEGSNAEQRRRLVGLNTSLRSSTVMEGDVLRGVTCTNYVYPTKALFGAVPPEKHIVVYGADSQGWAAACAALKRGRAADGPVTLVLERMVGNN